MIEWLCSFSFNSNAFESLIKSMCERYHTTCCLKSNAVYKTCFVFLRIIKSHQLIYSTLDMIFCFKKKHHCVIACVIPVPLVRSSVLNLRHFVYFFKRSDFVVRYKQGWTYAANTYPHSFFLKLLNTFFFYLYSFLDSIFLFSLVCTVVKTWWRSTTLFCDVVMCFCFLWRCLKFSGLVIRGT